MELKNNDGDKRVAQMKNEITKLREHNILLQEQCAINHRQNIEITRSSLRKILKPRSILMVDSAIFSSEFAYEDNIMPTMPVESFDLNDISLTPYTKGNQSDIYLLTLNNALVVAKLYHPKPPTTSFAIALKEARTLKYVNGGNKLEFGYIPVNMGVGIRTSKLNAGEHGYKPTDVYVLMSFHGDLDSPNNLTTFLSKVDTLDEEQASRLMYTLGLAVTNIHEQAYLHNNIIPNNILVEHRGTHLISVLVGFRLACRNDIVKPLTDKQHCMAKSNHFMAPELSKPGCAMSCQTDIFAYGKVCQEILFKVSNSTRRKSVYSFLTKCTMLSPSSRLETDDFYRQMVNVLGPHA